MKDNIINNFTKALNEYTYSQSITPSKMVTDNTHLEFIRCATIFLEAIVKKGKFKDEFEYTYSGGYFIHINAKSTKTDSKFHLGYCGVFGELVFSTDITNVINVHSLNEEFLLDFFSVANKHNIKYYESESGMTEIKHPQLRRRKNSNLLRFMGNYFLASEEDNVFHNYCFGQFDKTWMVTEDKTMEDIFDEACICMKWFYKFNYHLWKAESKK